MAREIKFRAWSKVEEEMVYGIDLTTQDGTAHPINGNWDNIMSLDERVELMQYTGLKDKNGVEIYEGDILSFDGNMTADDSFGLEPNGYIYDGDSKHEVVWNREQACWDLRHDEDEEWKYKRDTHHLMLDSSAIEVIGNIYENGDLLK